MFAGHVLAQAPAVEAGAPPPMPAEELDKLVAPIALYPDDLVAIILPAATNPLQLVQADRFLDKRKADPKLPVDDKWDDSVKALLNYPDVVKTMSADLDWTAALGEAVVADQGAVLEAIQVFRRKTQAVGNLKSDDKQVVVVEKEVIKIVPANPEVIYVPQYNPTTIVVAGGYPWGYWPTPYPVYYYPYPPGAAFATGLIWGAAIGAAWNGGHWNTNWGGGDININRNTNINTGNINRGGRCDDAAGQGGGTAWKSDKRPGQVSNTVGRTPSTGARGRCASRRGGRRRCGCAPSAQPAGGSLGGGAGQGAAGTAASAAQRAGSVSASPRDSFGGSGASRGGASARRCHERLRFRPPDADGQLARGFEPQLDVRRRVAFDVGGGGARGGGGGGRGGGGRR